MFDGCSKASSEVTLDLEAAYRLVSVARHLDERLWRLARAGKAHFAVPCAGHEAIGVGYGLALRTGYDFVAPHYRDLSAMLALGLTPEGAMPSFLGPVAVLAPGR